MTTIANKTFLTPGLDGIYQYAEAARYIKAGSGCTRRRRTIGNWFRRWTDDSELSESTGVSKLPVNFCDLVSMRLVAAFRETGLAGDSIRPLVEQLSKYAETQYPLASRDIWADYGWVDEIHDLLYPAAAYRDTGTDFGDLLEDILPEHGLTFDENSGQAISWEVRNGIVLHPLVQSGAPCIKGTRIPTSSLAGMVAAGDSEEWVAKSYQLTPETVRVACDWESQLKSI